MKVTVRFDPKANIWVSHDLVSNVYMQGHTKEQAIEILEKAVKTLKQVKQERSTKLDIMKFTYYLTVPEVIKHLTDYRDMGDDWDGYGSKPLDERVYKVACENLSKWFEEYHALGFTQMWPDLNSDGSVDMQFFKGDAEGYCDYLTCRNIGIDLNLKITRQDL